MDSQGHRLAAPLGYCPRCARPLEPRVQEDRERPTCPGCGFIHYLDPKVAVAVVVGDEQGIYLGKRLIDPARGAWSFPAGYVNRGEVLEEAAVREVLEEMAITVELRGLVGAYSTPGEAVILIVYAGYLLSGTPTPDGHEVEAIQRFRPDHLPALAFAHDAQIIADWRRVRLHH